MKWNKQKKDEESPTESPTCLRGAPCMDGSENELCQVSRFSSHSELLQCLSEKYCDCKLQFADVYFCTCPVRSDIFRKNEA